MITKTGDAVSHVYIPTKGESQKNEIDIDDVSELKMELVINTTNVMDSHSDVHMKGIWNKSIKEQKGLMLLQEHKMSFSNIITDNVPTSVVLSLKTSLKSLYWTKNKV